MPAKRTKKKPGDIIHTAQALNGYLRSHPSVWSHDLGKPQPSSFVWGQPFGYVMNKISKGVYAVVVP